MSRRPYKICPKKLELLRRKFGPRSEAVKEPSGPRVQKNLRIRKADAARLVRLAEREKVSQAALLARALDAYEQA